MKQPPVPFKTIKQAMQLECSVRKERKEDSALICQGRVPGSLYVKRMLTPLMAERLEVNLCETRLPMANWNREEPVGRDIVSPAKKYVERRE